MTSNITTKNPTNYDSTKSTLEHISKVKSIINIVLRELSNRAIHHDESKLSLKEKPFFDKYTNKLKNTTYGSKEYKKYLEELSPALEHHYKHNRHHPEFFEEGINGMTIIDLIEMFCDWKAATMRHYNGDLISSIEHNKDRFNMSDQLTQIFKNSVDLFNDIK